jgi:SAM-dependent methyltransferase
VLLDGSQFGGRLPCVVCRHARRRKTPAEWKALCGRCRHLSEDELEVLYWYQEQDTDRSVVPPNLLRHSRENSDARYLAALDVLVERGVPGGSRILDIGCGISAQADLFGQFDYFGADLNRVRLARGRRVNANAQYAVQDIRQLAWKDGAFAAVLCLEVIEHLPPEARPRLVRELIRTVEPGGLLILSTPNGKLTLWKYLLGRKCERSHEVELAPSDVADLVIAAGGSLLAVKEVDNLILPAGKIAAATVHLIAGRPKWRGPLQRAATRAGYETILYVVSSPSLLGGQPTGGIG